ncbi:hypothetical protein [Croceicoccus marinus]|uniref:Uncharacterized protein n=1 Tax=Croceicoccus marinus TaxID=450378 RepID=A0A7G6VTJ3_9SPHN|nr:hypothetical protein [Croceicoccus marinus]QNE05058.1 hypothetical protein H4O24_14345 [Croceicoccus marinus]
MNGITMDAMPSGLLAKKGAAKPAMRRQSQVQQAGFGSNANGLSGWLTGAEDDCGWNDMGDTPPASAGGSVIGLTPVSGKADSLYLHASGDDWDEAEGYDEDQRAEPGWTPAPVAAANPVGAMQSRLREAAVPAPQPAFADGSAASFEQPAFTRPDPAIEDAESPVGLLGHVRAMLAHLGAMIFGRGPVLVVHPDHALREKLSNAAAREGCSEVEIAERAILRYVDTAPRTGFTSSHVMGNA